MPLIYSSVSQGTVTLAEYAAFSGNFGAVAKDYLEKAGKVSVKGKRSEQAQCTCRRLRQGLRSAWHVVCVLRGCSGQAQQHPASNPPNDSDPEPPACLCHHSRQLA